MITVHQKLSNSLSKHHHRLQQPPLKKVVLLVPQDTLPVSFLATQHPSLLDTAAYIKVLQPSIAFPAAVTDTPTASQVIPNPSK